MRASEFIREDASAVATSAGSIAPVSQTLGAIVSRMGFGQPAKYTNSYPVKKRKQNARG